MLDFRCDSCSAKLFFENDTCLKCGKKVGFRATDLSMCTVEAAAAAGLAQCRNWLEYAACNWFAPGADGTRYCVSCSLNEVVPDLGDWQRRALWILTERAKRRLIFTVLELRLPLLGVGEREPLRFRLLADERANTGAVDPPEEEPVYIGHDNGRITLNVVEADDALREAIRKRLNEPYRTMLGHMRHEIGHYYWYLLVGGTPRVETFRALFGDEQVAYGAALQRYYETGPPAEWQLSFVSAYATMHPWEDFAETWAHYIHILDTVETASASELAIEGNRLRSPLPLDAQHRFADVLAAWAPLTVCLNQLNRSMGMRDAYPFALSDKVAEKLRFVDDICRGVASGEAVAADSGVYPAGPEQQAEAQLEKRSPAAASGSRVR
jgi:hypothetical protein